VPPIDTEHIVSLYSGSGVDWNHPYTTIFPQTIKKELEGQVQLGICTAYPQCPAPPDIISPMSASIQKSAISKAATVTGILIEDEPSLDAANIALLALGHSKVKVRACHDATAPGLNQASLVPSYGNSGIEDAIPGLLLG
jgi:hypothetical protein